MWLRWILAFSLLACAHISFAQKKIPVDVIGDPNQDDLVGQRLVFAVKEAIRASQGMVLLQDTSRARLVVGFSTMRIGSDNTAVAVILSFDEPALPLNGYLLSGYVKGCSATRVKECAEEILAYIDQQMGRLRQSPALWNKL
jgi:hypothetical protein